MDIHTSQTKTNKLLMKIVDSDSNKEIQIKIRTLVILIRLVVINENRIIEII